MNAVLSKYRGTLVGALVGDCLGANYEGISCIIPFGEVTDYTMSRIKDKKDSIRYTDDSAMTRAVCKSLMEQKKYDNRSMATEFVKEFFKDPTRGYGQAVGRVFERLRDDDPEDITLPARCQFDGQGSYGNGAAMRISPLALFSKNSHELQEVRCLWGIGSYMGEINDNALYLTIIIIPRAQMGCESIAHKAEGQVGY